MDSATYIISALLIGCLKGDFRVEVSKEATTEKAGGESMVSLVAILHCIFAPFTAFCSMVYDVVRYLHGSGFGFLVLLKSTGSAVWGFADVLNVTYATVADSEDTTVQRLGLIYTSMGIGFLIGPIIANLYTDADKPATMQLVCISGFGVMMLGWYGIGTAPNFASICAFAALKTTGSSIIWINSSLILQTLAQDHMMGRVMAFEFALCMFSDAMSATIAGMLLDQGVQANQIAMGASALAALLFMLWSFYHSAGKGAAKEQFNTVPNKDCKAFDVANP